VADRLQDGGTQLDPAATRNHLQANRSLTWERRAKEVLGYLLAKGIDTGRVTIVSFGKEKPVCMEHNEACWSKNRRDDFLTKRK
jgi:peptidoglycan-associated lipoprotein